MHSAISPFRRPAMVFVAAVFLIVALPAEAFWSSTKKKEDDTRVDYSVVTIPQSPRETPVEYGVDVSFPMHYSKVSNNYAWLPHNLDSSTPTPPEYEDMVVQPLGDRQKAYDDFIKSCVDAFGRKGQRCIDTERDRVDMSLRQPQSMQNYTAIGYKKIRAPESLWKLIKTFWENNHDKAKTENWGTGNTYTNNWESPSAMVSVEDSSLRGGGYKLKQQLWNAAKDIISQWTGQEVTQCSLYGIRIYHKDSILSTHVDRLPLVSSAIINVAQDLDEPWPLEVVGHDGKAKNVTMEPGDMVLYESHSVLHGRPFPLKGRYMANIFIHFEPTGHSMRHNAKIAELGDGGVDERYREATARGISGHENDNTGLPPYLIPGTPEEVHWRQAHPSGAKRQQTSTFTTGSTPAHTAAQQGRVATLEDEIKKKKEVVNARDKNGWTPLHEGARGGHLDVVKLLIDNGADMDAKTHGSGGTPLWWAKQNLEEDHPVIEFLEGLGALEVGPEL